MKAKTEVADPKKGVEKEATAEKKEVAATKDKCDEASEKKREKNGKADSSNSRGYSFGYGQLLWKPNAQSTRKFKQISVQ